MRSAGSMPSSLSEKALSYRQQRGTPRRARADGTVDHARIGYGGRRYFYPHAASVGLSFNPYRWNPKINLQAGVVRLVAGLGTRAVAVPMTTTRLIALQRTRTPSRHEFRRNRPTRPAAHVDVLDLEEAASSPVHLPS